MYTYRFEVVMSVLAYAFACINKAYEIVETASDSTFSEKSKEATVHLRTAAGIFQYVISRELPAWENMYSIERSYKLSHICFFSKTHQASRQAS